MHGCLRCFPLGAHAALRCRAMTRSASSSSSSLASAKRAVAPGGRRVVNTPLRTPCNRATTSQPLDGREDLDVLGKRLPEDETSRPPPALLEVLQVARGK